MKQTNWPALKGPANYPPSVATRRAVYGKVHRAPTDYRWIAWSEAFNDHPPTFERLLNVGNEEVPDVCSWRCSEETGPLAVRYYASRAFDAAGRPAGIEKQVLGPANDQDRIIPPAVLAFLLLPAVEHADDTVWWESWRDPRWSSQSYSLLLPDDPQITPELSLDSEGLLRAFQRGLSELLELVTPESLASFYSQLIHGAQPAVLRTRQRHLTPHAMAALLLPLDRSSTENFSIAGGIQSELADPEMLINWRAVVCPPGVSVPVPPFEEISPEAGPAIVRKLQEGLANGGRLPIKYSVGGRFLLDFMQGTERWPAPGGAGIEALQALGPWPLVTDKAEMEDLREKVGDFLAAPPPNSAEALRHLATKDDLVRALLLVLCPGMDSLEVAKIPVTGRVPALLFLHAISRDQWDSLAEQWGEVPFAALVQKSLQDCFLLSLSQLVRSWLLAGMQDLRGGLFAEYTSEALQPAPSTS